MSAHPMTQAEINKLLWQVSCHFRGAVDPVHYKEYILSILFLKYISVIRRDKVIVPQGASFQEIYKNRFSKHLGSHINEALLAIERANKATLAGVFRGIDFDSEIALGKTAERESRLIALLEGLNRLTISPTVANEDIIGNSYIYLLSKFASGAGKKAGEFYTPYSVARLLAQLAKPKSGDTICDPTCGSGALLIEAAKQADRVNLFGMEVNHSAWSLAQMNMLIHGHNQAQIEWCDTLRNPALHQDRQLMSFDIVLANPPFSLKNWGKEEANKDPFHRFWRGIPPTGDYAFISHMIEVAKPKKGRVITIGPPGLLFHKQVEGKIRKQLIEENLLDTVINLPEKLFSTTDITVVILIFDRRRERGGEDADKRDILFIDASKHHQKNHRALTNSQIDKVITTYKQRQPVKKYASLASLQEVRDNQFNLSLPLYVDNFEPEELVNIQQLQTRLDQIESKLTFQKSQITHYLLELMRHE